MRLFISLLLIIINFAVFPEDIAIVNDTDIIFQQSDKGYDLYIKRKTGIQSILLTDSQKDPEFQQTTYSLRTPEYNDSNSKEQRILDNKIMKPQSGIYFLIDSTPETHPKLGEVFHFYLPPKVLYGYSWTRNGSISIEPGVKINLRLFEKKYADYSGKFKDQWITLKLSENTATTPESQSLQVENREPDTLPKSDSENPAESAASVEQYDTPDPPETPEAQLPALEIPAVQNNPKSGEVFQEDVVLRDADGNNQLRTVYKIDDKGKKATQAVSFFA